MVMLHLGMSEHYVPICVHQAFSRHVTEGFLKKPENSIVAPVREKKVKWLTW